MYRQPNPDYQVSPVEEPLFGTGIKSPNAQPGTGYDYARSLDYETRADWKLDAPSRYDLQGPMPAPNAAGSIRDEGEDHMRSDMYRAVDQQLQPEDFAQAIASWQPEHSPEKMPIIAADDHEFESDAPSLETISFNAEIVVQPDDHTQHGLDTAAFGDESSYHVPASTRARWELLKSLVRAREGPHDEIQGEESTTSASSGSRTRPNHFQGSPPARNSTTSMRTLMLPQIVEKRKSVEGLHSGRQAADATNPLQEPLSDQRQQSTAIQQHPSNQQQTLHQAAHLPAHQSPVSSTDRPATSGGHHDSLSTIVSAPQQVSGKSLGDNAMSRATLGPPTDTRSQQPVMPTLESKDPLPQQQKSRPMPNLGSKATPNLPTKNPTVLETAHVQSSPPHRPQQTASAMPQSGAATAILRQGEQKPYSPQMQPRTSASNAPVSSASVQSPAIRGGTPLVAPPQPTSASAVQAGPAPSPPRATRNSATGSPPPVHPNLGESQHSSALQPAQKPSYPRPAVTPQPKLAHTPSMPAAIQPPAATQHPQRPRSSQAMQPSPATAQHQVPSQQTPKPATTAQPRSNFPTATHPPAPQASAAPQAPAAHPQALHPPAAQVSAAHPPAPHPPAAHPPAPHPPAPPASAAHPPAPRAPAAHLPAPQASAARPPAPHPPAPPASTAHPPAPHPPAQASAAHPPAPHPPAPHPPAPQASAAHPPAPHPPAPQASAARPPVPHPPAPLASAAHPLAPHPPAPHPPAPHPPAPHPPAPQASAARPPAPHPPAPHPPAPHPPAPPASAAHPPAPRAPAAHLPAPQASAARPPAPHPPAPPASAAHPPAPHPPAPHPPAPQASAARPPTPHPPAPPASAAHPPAPHPPAPPASAAHPPAPHPPAPPTSAARPPAPHPPTPQASAAHLPAPQAPAAHPPAPHPPAPQASAAHPPAPQAPAARPLAPHPPAPQASSAHSLAPHPPAPHPPAPHPPAPQAPAAHPLTNQTPAPHVPVSHAPASQAPTPHTPTPSATAAAPKLASNKPPAKPQQIAPRAAQASGGNTHGTPPQLHPRQQSVIPNTTPSMSSQPSRPSQPHPQQGHPQAATVSGAQGSSPVPPSKRPLTPSDTLAAQTKHPSQTIEPQHVPSISPKPTSATNIPPTNHPGPANRPTPPNLANQVTSTNHAASASQQNRASSLARAAADTPSALQASTISSAPSHSHADSDSSASKRTMPGDASCSSNPGSLPRMGAAVRRNTPTGASALPQNAMQGMHPSGPDPNPILQTEPSNVFSTDSGPSESESQHACETEGSENSNIFKLFGQLVGGQTPEEDLSPEQEAENLVQMFLYGTALVFKSYIGEVAMGDGWVEKI